MPLNKFTQRSENENYKNDLKNYRRKFCSWIRRIHSVKRSILPSDLVNVISTHDGMLFSHKKDASLSSAATWMKLEDIILNEISQTQKDKYISLICGS